MHEYLTYFSPSTGQFIHLGEKYGSLIMYHNLRDYSATYNSSNGKLNSWNDNVISNTSFTVKWILPDQQSTVNYRKAFQDLIDADITANRPGRLYFEDQFYINCFIYAQELSNTLIDGRFAVSKFTIVTDDPYFYRETNLSQVPTRQEGINDIEPNTGMTDGCVGCELEVTIVTNSLTTPVAVLNWYYEDLYRGYPYTYGLVSHTIEAGDGLYINTKDKTVYSDYQGNLFRYRIKSGKGTFQTPNGFFRYVFLGSGGSNNRYVGLTIYSKYRAIPASMNYGKALSTAEDYGPAAIPEWI